MGCEGPARQQQPDEHYRGPALVIPTARASRGGHVARWLTELRRELAPVNASHWHVGERVWAAVPRGEHGVDVAVYRMVGPFDGVVSLLDRSGQRVDGVPPALIHRAHRIGKLRVGDVVLCDAAAAAGVLARVVALDGAIRVTHAWGTTTETIAVDHAEPPRTGVTPLAYVSYTQRGRLGRGLVLAVGPRHVWLRDAAGNMRTVARAAVQALRLPTQWTEQQKVVAYRWPSGGRRGRIAGLREHGLLVEVAHDDGSRGEYFFAQLAAVTSETAPAAR